MSQRETKSGGAAVVVAVLLLVIGLFCLLAGGLFLGFVWLALNEAHP